ncbi:MFS transporter [Saccharopolyspora montiporae]|uniref:MFS transporter n=1 Tax=Saccharopolyspora montiporae TaxID=2781240 RepID=UPI001D14100F|nr:MFS transporter [Saccharopolyspora sp. HNM0983]
MSAAAARRALPVLLLCVVCTQTALNVARPLISYRAIALGGDALAIGLITSAYAVLSLAVALPLGRFTDRTGRNTVVLTAGTVLLVLGPVLLAAAPSLPLLACAAALLGFGHIVFMVGGQGFIARMPDADLDRNFGYFTAAVSAGQMLGPLLAGALLGEGSGADLAGPTAFVLVLAGLVAAAGLPSCVLLLRAPAPRPPVAGSADAAPSALHMLRSPGMVGGLFTSLALLAAVDLLTAYLPLIAHERGIAPAVAGVLLALRSAASISSRLLLPRLLRRWSRRVLIGASSLGAGVFLAVLTLPGAGVAGMAIALAVGGFLLGIGQPLTMTAVVKSVPGHARGAALALRLWANRTGQVAIPAVAGVAAGALGAAGALWFAALVLVAASGTARRTPADEPGPDRAGTPPQR